MTQRSIRGRLELTWMGKDQALIPTTAGNYDYAWVPKDDPRACQTHYLVEDDHFGDQGDGGIHDNLLITGESGDVLEALTRVPELADKYVGQVKCVYIDPPFNTGGVFTHYEDNLEHSVWLTFMRDRLLLLKKLLADDGSIWVHLNDSENHRMRVLLDEVFGAGNYITELVWQKKTSSQSDSSGISTDTDVIYVYSKVKAEFSPNGLPRTLASELAYSNPDDDPRGPWREGDYKMDQGSMYPIIHPATGAEVYPPEGKEWRYSLQSYEQHLKDNRLWWGKTGNYRYPKFKRFRTEVPNTRIPNNLLLAEDVDTTRRAKTHIKKLFPGVKPFDTPKPERLLERVLHIATQPGDLVLDVFAGSGTTAAVAHKMQRRWVTVELKPDTVQQFTLPRLQKVVKGADPDGITYRTEDVGKDPLPGDTTPEEAKLFRTVLTRTVDELRAIGGSVEKAEEKELIKALRKLTATTTAKEQIWSGGGGFTQMHLSPVWVGVEQDDLSDTQTAYITPEATGEVLQRSIAGHLGFRLTPESPRFAGIKGHQVLAVVEGMLTASILDELLAALPESHSLTLVCDGAAPGIDRDLRKRARGSRLLVMPDDLFTTRRSR